MNKFRKDDSVKVISGAYKGQEGRVLKIISKKNRILVEGITIDHLMKKEYREGALIFAEGYQKYPSSLKAPDNLYKLSEALSKIDKNFEACNTLNKFNKEHPKHKLSNKANLKIQELKCE